MINLLPPDVKQSYRYARYNVTLRRWVIAFLVAFVGLGGIATYGLLTLHQSTSHYNAQIANTEQLFQKEKFAQTQTDVQNISNSFLLVVKVLGQEVLFSKLLNEIATLIPSNANLTGLNINQAQGGLDITANASDYATATQVQVNLADPSDKVFSKADLVSIACNGSNTLNPEFPCTVDVRVLFSANNPFLFINSGETKP
jgi:type II secretory pathway component PulL